MTRGSGVIPAETDPETGGGGGGGGWMRRPVSDKPPLLTDDRATDSDDVTGSSLSSVTSVTQTKPYNYRRVTQLNVTVLSPGFQ